MKIILLTGTFDILTPGHIKLFKYARTLGEHVIVCLDTDRMVKEKKGTRRPFFNQDERIEMLNSIKFIDDVVLFDSDEDLESICWNTLPDIRLVGSDYKDKTIIGGKFCKEIRYFDRIEKYSSTKVLENKNGKIKWKILKLIFLI